MDVKIEASLKKELKDEFEKDYFQKLASFVRKEYTAKTIYPPSGEIFRAFNLCPFEKTKVVIIGQDPYHGENQAHGLCFSVGNNSKIPPSLRNIYKELHTDIGKPIPNDGNIDHWAEQGVLMLNAILTVIAKAPQSHQNQGWEIFTNAVISKLNMRKKPIVFLLWGAYAQRKGALIDTKKHLVLKTTHPSPFSAQKGFLGSKHFSKTNDFLVNQGLSPIRW